MTSINKLPAPTNMISLTICSCKSACNSNRCRCKKYLNCSDACRCLNCKNVAETKHSYEQVADKDSDDIWSLFWKIQAWKLEFWMTCFILGVSFYFYFDYISQFVPEFSCGFAWLLFILFNEVKVKLLLLLLL